MGASGLAAMVLSNFRAREDRAFEPAIKSDYGVGVSDF
jgi:hypothetical protein